MNGLVRGAVETLVNAHVPQECVVVARVPGSFELPLACAEFARRREFCTVIALGCIVRGETTHNTHIANAVFSALTTLSLETSKPIALGVVTAETMEQAAARAGGANGNRGADAAHAAIEMLSLLTSIRAGAV
ncbi:MAG: 6,7-dimethyl-8-ribityllumazine synthase [Armatimonadetes bacterium]|nr:6,7-dimethyl-8-ribityllumazine synthase [Armatimonadota bacterium]MDE2207050.1 6,7-dimethyl-8-ribityllumazine synthase [Armatimonadota bacterium]